MERFDYGAGGTGSQPFDDAVGAKHGTGWIGGALNTVCPLIRPFENARTHDSYYW